ncbi:MAG: amidohydrolase [Candidatus Eisenbacteria bacterium]|nr:amidohydrolase [Candidatus Eisenbacteria bacterium]
MVRLRRDLHRHPELGMREQRTAGVVTEHLRAGGLEVRTGIAQTGVVGLVRGADPFGGRAVLFRADMDGLPLQEENPVEYASSHQGVMHACGHDGHTAILLETAREAFERRATLRGSWTYAFQPAEEGPGGAKPMIEQGVLRDPNVEACFGLHLWNTMPVGTVGVKAGPAMAAADEFELWVEGKGGHGAYPHGAIDAVMVGSQIVTAIQSIVSRNVDPFETAVVTVGTFNAGSNFNIIAEKAHMKGTIRTFNSSVRSLLIRRVEETASRVAEALGARCRVVFTEVYPATHNDPVMSDFVAEIAAEVVGAKHVLRNECSMGAEDMSYFLEAVPGCYFFLGSSNSERGLIGQHHSPRFDFDEDAMQIGAEIFLRIQERYFDRFPTPPVKA